MCLCLCVLVVYDMIMCMIMFVTAYVYWLRMFMPVGYHIGLVKSMSMCMLIGWMFIRMHLFRSLVVVKGPVLVEENNGMKPSETELY